MAALLELSTLTEFLGGDLPSQAEWIEARAMWDRGCTYFEIAQSILAERTGRADREA